MAEDAGVQQVLSRRPGARVKLRQMEGHVSAFVVERRGEKWFNVSNQLPPGDLSVIASAVGRSAAGSNWKAVETKAR